MGILTGNINTGVNLQKLAAEENIFEKVAEAMDFMAEHGIDPIGGLTLLANTDENGNIVDEKVAAVAEAELTPEQADALMKVAEYLGGVDEKVAEAALILNDAANEMVEKVAEAIDYVEGNFGVPFEDVMYLGALASNPQAIDEKTASEIIAAGYDDEDLAVAEKIAAEVAEYTGLDPVEAIEVASIIKEAGIKDILSKAKETIVDAGKAYKDALKGEGIEKLKKDLEFLKKSHAPESFKEKRKQLINARLKQLGAASLPAAAAGAGYYGYKKLKKDK